MTDTNQNPPQETPKKIKPPGPIRWNAIIPFSFFGLLVGLYFHFIFDSNVRSALEWAGTKVVGAEVNIGTFKTSLLHANLQIKDVEVTDADNPSHNSLNIGEIRFAMLWDALLRLKFVINEAVVEQIEFGKKRLRIGKVLPPPPPEPEKTGPSALEKEADKLKKTALSQVETQFNDNVLGDVASLLGGTKGDVKLDQLQDSLVSKKMLETLGAELNKRQNSWNERMKSLPQGKEFQVLMDRLGKVKTSNFKSPQELADSLKEVDTILKDGEAKYKKLQLAKSDLDSDLKLTQDSYQQLEAQIKADIKSVEKHFKIPQLDAKSLTLSMFKKYLDPYMAKVNHYQKLAQKYLPPNLLKKKTPNSPPDVSLRPHPREKGTTYEFGRINSYPLFWVKKIAISSQAGSSPEAGNIKGEVLDLTSHQVLVGKPTLANLAGDFPGSGISGFQTKVSVDTRGDVSNIGIMLKVASYPVIGRPLVQSNDVAIDLVKAQGSLDITGTLVGLTNLTLKIANKYTNASYDIKAKESTIQEILKGVFNGLPSIEIDAQAKGILPNVSFDIESDVGKELQRGFEKQIQAKIDEARRKIQALIDDQISAQKTKIDAQINQFKNQFDKEIKKLQEQAENQKKIAEGKADQAKKDSENQARKKLENEGQKAIDGLKKKFGF